MNYLAWMYTRLLQEKGNEEKEEKKEVEKWGRERCKRKV